MDLYTVMNSSSELNNVSFHLVQLPSDFELTQSNSLPILLQKYASDPSQLNQFKSISSIDSPYLTTPTSSYKLRQQNHSNCIMLFHEQTSFLSFNNYLIMEKIDSNSINVENKSIINSLQDLKQFDTDPNSILTLDSVIQIYSGFKKILTNSPIAPINFDSIMISQNLIPNGNQILQITDNLISTLLIPLISSIPNSLRFNPLNPSQLSKIIKSTFNSLIPQNHQLLRILTFILLKFTKIDKPITTTDYHEIDQFLYYTIPQNEHLLNHEKIIKFVALQSIKNQTEIPLPDLLIQIRTMLPLDYQPQFEPQIILRGIAYTLEKDNITIVKYLPQEQLNFHKSASERFNYLFTLKPVWSLEEISPFVDDEVCNPRHLKADKLSLKHARLRRNKQGTLFLSKR
ncbi:hypothetical protein CANINC_001304 [Pichia inconspicua]|uniref:Sister chromatid cohesion protein DCC1 n=1 Tax=Pichia inconspicua TaxID=52247 RepID=A0A4T0X5A2_9ASCO|nr:hypothetical protein CANINC_001304 [[Candida] inconspicua]